MREAEHIATTIAEQIEDRLAAEGLDQGQTLAALLAHLSVGVGLVDLEGRTLMLNKTGLEMHGFHSLEEMLVQFEDYRESFKLYTVEGQLLPPEQWPLTQALRGTFVKDFPVRLRRSNGAAERIIAYSAIPVAAGGSHYIAFVMIDRTEQYHAQQALRESREKYRSLFNSIDEGFCVIEVIFDDQQHPCDFLILEVNPVFESLTGIADGVGRSMREIAPHLEQYWFDLYGGVALTGEPVRCQHVARALGRHFDLFAFRIGTPGENRVAVLFNDISRRVQAEVALQEKEAELKKITELTPLVLVRCGRDLRFRFVNRAAAELIGLPPEKIIGRSIGDIAGQEALDRVRPYIERVLTGQSVEFELEMSYRTRGRRWMRVNYAPDFNEQGEVIGWLASILDITKRKRAEIALAEANRRKDEFLATLAHELRNPLAPLRFSTSLLAISNDDPERLVETLGMMDRQLDKMVYLIDGLLDISRINSGKVVLQNSHVTLRKVLESALESNRPFLLQRNHEVRLEIPAQPLHIEGDVLRLEQVFSNLISNAAKYTEEGGQIRIVARGQQSEVVISVSDTGMGISSEHMAGLFDMFSQVDSALERSQEGLGIGLSLVKGLVELHGGTVEAKSAGLGHGSEFLVRLPLAEPPREVLEQSQPPAKHEADSGSYRILVVDDNHDNVKSLALLLNAKGHTVDIAYDGESAVQAVENFQPELVLLDIGMPGMNGYETACEIRARHGVASPKLIALTGWGQQEDIRRAQEAGFDRHLTKPVNPNRLDQVIRETTE